MWWDDGDIYIGGYKNDNRTEGKMYEVQHDGTHTLYNVKYDEYSNEIEKELISQGHKLA
jgi:hypothetical protein